MSIISSVHSFVAYNPKAPLAPIDSTQRVAKVKFRITEAAKLRGELEKEAKAVSIPKILPLQVQEEAAALMPFVIGMLEGVQDSIIRDLVAAGKTDVRDEQISIAACMAYMQEETSNGGRMSGDDVKAWFTDTLEDKLSLAFADKLGVTATTATPEQEAKIQQIVNAYRDKLAMLASPKTRYDVVSADKMLGALQLVADEPQAALWIARINKMKQAEGDLLLAL